MFTVTRAAAKQVRRAAASGDMEELALRVAATRTGDGGIDYRMGFDEIGAGDKVFSTSGIDVVITAGDEALLDNGGARLRRDRRRRPPFHLPQSQRPPTTARPARPPNDRSTPRRSLRIRRLLRCVAQPERRRSLRGTSVGERHRSRRRRLGRTGVVPRRGLEPPQGFPHMDLNHARLPIPPPRRGRLRGGQRLKAVPAPT